MRGGGGAEGGNVTLFVAVAAMGLLAAVGLVFDGGYLLAARRQALTEADGAARAAAQQVTSGSLLGSDVALDPAAAEQAARSFLAPTGHQGDVVVDGNRVTVTVRATYRLKILPGGTRRVTGVGTASAERGI